MKDIYRYGSDVNSHDLLKIAAITTMVIDHIGNFFLINIIWFRVIGRFAAPQFFFLVGFSGSYRFKKSIFFYGIGLWIIHYLTDPSIGISDHIIPFNILISFVIIKEILHRFNVASLPSGSLLLLLSVLLLVSLPTYLVIEYGTLGLCYAIGARLLTQHHDLRRVWMVLTVIVHLTFEMMFVLILNPDVSTSLLPYAVGLLVVVFAVNLTVFMNYRFRIFKIKYKHLRTLSIYVSRYSLEIYFFHISAFMIASYIWNPVA